MSRVASEFLGSGFAGCCERHGGIFAALSPSSRRNLGGAELEPSTGIKLLGEDSEARIRFQGLIRTMDDIAQITGRG